MVLPLFSLSPFLSPCLPFVVVFPLVLVGLVWFGLGISSFHWFGGCLVGISDPTEASVHLVLRVGPV